MSCHPLHLEGSRPHYLFVISSNFLFAAKADFASTESMNPECFPGIHNVNISNFCSPFELMESNHLRLITINNIDNNGITMMTIPEEECARCTFN